MTTDSSFMPIPYIINYTVKYNMEIQECTIVQQDRSIAIIELPVFVNVQLKLHLFTNHFCSTANKVIYTITVLTLMYNSTRAYIIPT